VYQGKKVEFALVREGMGFGGSNFNERKEGFFALITVTNTSAYSRNTTDRGELALKIGAWVLRQWGEK